MPIGCNQCFFNRAGAYYTDTPTIPTPEEVGDDIVRMNCGNDSNINRALVIRPPSDISTHSSIHQCAESWTSLARSS